MIDIKEIKSITQNKDGSFDVQSKKSSNNYTYFTVNWKRIPRFDQKGNKIDPDIFREDVIAKNGIEYWNQNFACVSGDTFINIFDEINQKNITITVKELWDLMH